MARIAKSGKKTARRPLASCIVTVDLLGQGEARENNAAIAAIAQKFATAGDNTTLLWVPRPDRIDKIGAEELEQLRQYLFEKFLINLILLPRSKDMLAERGTVLKQSIAVYHYLREQQFDTVHFALEGGLAYYSLLAKETGVFANPPQLCVIAQSPIDWTSEADKFFLRNIEQVTCAFMEKYCVETCDHLISTSKAALDWMRRKKWSVPKNSKVILPLVPHEWKTPAIITGNKTQQISELVFLSGPEFHKGLTLLCDALDKAAKELPDNLTITLMGRFGRILGEHTGGMLLRRGRNWPFKLKLLPRASERDCLSYLRANRALAVFPSLASSTNLWLSCCIAESLPFIATNVGSAPEHLAPHCLAECLCEPTAGSLAQKIISTVKKGGPTAVSSREFQTRSDDWTKHLDAIANESRSNTRSKSPVRSRSLPLVSIVLVHHDRPQLLMQAVNSVEQQDYKKLELVLVDDGSKLPESHAVLGALERRFKKRGWRILREKNRYLGAARNTGVRAARGSRILFLDDDNVLFPSAISTLVRAMDQSGADICTCFQRIFYGDAEPKRTDIGYIQYFALGGSLDIGFIQNCFGDANAMVRREVFDKIGYQAELFGLGGEDWEFFARATLAGLKLRVVPEPLYWYRSNTRGMFRSSHWFETRITTLNTFREHGFKGLEHLYHLALSAHVGRWEIESLRDNLRFSPSDARFLELCDLNPESDEAVDKLAAIAATEGRADTALILLGQGKQADSFAKIAERVGTRTEIERALAEINAGVLSTTELSYFDLRMFMTSALSSGSTAPLFYVEKNPDRLYLEGYDRPSVATLPARCPPSTISVSVTVGLDQAIAEPTEFMLLLLPTHLDPTVAVEQAGDEPTERCSGWCEVLRPHQSRQIEVRLSEPSSSTMNLVVAVRSASGIRSRPTTGCFSEFSIKHLLRGEHARRPRTGAPPTRLRARDWSREDVTGAQLLTNYPSTLPLLLLPPEGGIFLRPSNKGPVVAKLDRCFPPFARQAIGYVEIAHEDASPFEFAMALTQPGHVANWHTDTPGDCLGFSGWRRVEEKFQLHEIVLENKQLSVMPLAVNMAIRLPKGSKPAPANAYWRKVVFTWDE